MTDKKTNDKPVGGNVYQRMHRAAALIEKRIPKSNENTFQKFKYASHDDVVEFCRPALLEAGLVLTCDMPEIESSVETFGGKPTMVARGTLCVDVVNIDDPKDRYTVHVPGMAYDTSDKAIGKLISYAKKYALTACCGLLVATGEDIDRDDIQGVPKKSTRGEVARETQTARTVILKDITRTRDALGWTKDDLAAFSKTILNGKSAMDADPADLQKLFELMRDELNSVKREEEATNE